MAEVYCGSEPCPLFLNSTCVFYTGESLLYIGVQNNDTLETIIVKINQAFQNAGVGYAFTNGLIQPTPFQPVQLGGALIQNTTIGGNFTLSFTGNVQAARHITTGGTSSQFVKGDGTLDSTAYQPAANYITGLSGDATASGPGVAAMTLTTVNFAPGTFGNGNTIPIVTVNAKGLVTNITPVPVTIPPLPLTFIGDVVGSGFTGSNITLLLQNVNANPYNTITPLKFSVNGKGLVTSASPITASDIVNILGYYPGTSGTSGTDGTSGTSGTTGTSGTSGTSGSAGTSGTTGTSGTSGTDGSGGTSGTSGTSATAGTSGSSGTSGTTGTSGTSATSGTSGTSGTDGTGGTSGTSGSTGTSGTSGTSGTAGTSGTSGTTGSSGTSGTSGSTGTSGSSGTTGTSGSSGTTGTSGSSGTSGTTGVDGTSGTSGTTGTSGSSGLSGDRFKTTSTTTYTLQAPGNPGTLTVDPGLAYTVAQSIIIAFDANNHNEAEVTSYNSVTGVINFVTFTLTGSGTYSSWFINIDGASGGDGSSGSSGTSGTSATAGTSGTTGTSGSSGTSGTTGTSGSSGTSGTSATDGTGGTSGTSGSSGTSGTTGTSGTSATSGTSGTSATSGTTGTSGTSGTNGTGGTSGTSGTSATSGTSGSSGTSPASQVTGTGTAGQVSYWSSGSAITGESQFVWDAVNNRLGIGQASPLANIHVNSNLSDTPSELILSNAGQSLPPSDLGILWFGAGEGSGWRAAAIKGTAEQDFNDNYWTTSLNFWTTYASATPVMRLNISSTGVSSFYGDSGSTAVSIGVAGGGTKADFNVTENVGVVLNVNEGASARTFDLQIAGASAMAITTDRVAAFSNDVTSSENVNSYRRFRLYFNDIQTLAAELYEDGASTNGGTLTLYGKASGTVDTVISAAPTKLNYINNAANVMIGWNTDQFYKLAVNGDFYAALDARVGGNLGVGAAPISGVSLYIKGNSVDSPLLIMQGNTNRVALIGDTTTGTTDVGKLLLYNAGVDTIMLSALANEESFINNSGGTFTVGATSSGGYKLAAFKADEDILRIHNTTTTGDALIAFTNADPGFLARIQGTDGGGLQFDVGNGAGGLITNALRIAPTGQATFISHVNSGGWFAAPNDYGLTALNAAGTAGRVLIKLNSSNQIEIGRDSDISAIRLGTASAVDAFTMLSNGNVGIAFTNPSQALQVNGRVRVSPDSSNGGDLAVNDGGLALSAIGSAPIQFWRSNYNYLSMIIDSNGNLGVGTTNLPFRLNIESTSEAVARIKSTNASGAARLILNPEGAGAGSTGDASIFFDCNSTAWVAGVDKSDSSRFKIAVDPYGDFRAGVHLSIDNVTDRSNVVIGGTTAVNSAVNRGNLTINGNSTSILAFGTSNVQRGYLYCDGTSFYMNAGAGDFTIENNTTTALVVKQNGRVGINTTDPQAPLQVNGNFRLYTTNNDGNELRGIFNVGGAGDPLSFSMYKADAATIGILLSADGTTYFNGTNVLVGTTSDIGTAFRVVGGATGIDFETNNTSTFATSIFNTIRETGVSRTITTGGYSFGPANPLTMILTQNSNTPLGMFYAADNADGAGLKGFKSRGTVSAPVSVSNGDTIFSMEGWAFHGSGPNHAKFGAGIKFVKDDAFGTANTYAPQRTEFYNADTTTTLRTNMIIYPNGNVAIGSTTYSTAKLFVDGDIRTGTLDTGYVAGFWKLGRAVIGTQPSETYQIIVEINGQLFTIGAALI